MIDGGSRTMKMLAPQASPSKYKSPLPVRRNLDACACRPAWRSQMNSHSAPPPNERYPRPPGIAAITSRAAATSPRIN